MSGFCSAHKYHSPDCGICESANISPAEREAMIAAQEIADSTSSVDRTFTERLKERDLARKRLIYEDIRKQCAHLLK